MLEVKDLFSITFEKQVIVGFIKRKRHKKMVRKPKYETKRNNYYSNETPF